MALPMKLPQFTQCNRLH